MNEQPFSLLKWIEANPALVSLIAIPIAALIGAWVSTLFTRFGGHGIKEIVADPASRDGVIRKYGGTRRSGYFAAIGWVLGKAEQWYGEKPFSNQSFARCIQIAYLYPPIALIAGWVLFNAGRLGGLPFLPVDIEWMGRLWLATLLLGLMVVSFWIFSKVRDLSIWIDKSIKNLLARFDQRTGLLAKTSGLFSNFSDGFALVAAFFITTAFTTTATVSIAVAFELFALFALVYSVSISFAVGLTISFVDKIVSTVAIAFVAAFILGVGIAVIGASTRSAQFSVVVFFYSLLPFLNALADFISIGVTRKFLTHIRKTEPGFWRILFDLILDLLIAALCLAGLIGSMLLILEFWAWIAPTTLAFDWLDYWDAIQSGDWGQATILILMVITTLIPTILHLVFGLAGFWMAETKSWAKAVTKLQTAGSAEMPAIEQAEIIRLIRRGTFLGWFRSLITVGLGCAILGWLVFRYILPLLA